MNKKQKELIVIFIGIFLIVGIAMSWENISWVFNYRELSGLWDAFFYPYENQRALASNNSITTTVKNTKERPYISRENSIEIPRIGIVAPVVIGQSTDISVLEQDLNRGVVYYPGSAAPGQPGHSVLLGHSAPLGWPKIKYDWVFTALNNLENEDSITLYFNNRQYTYKVIDKEIIPKGQDLDTTTLNGSSNVLVLVSCWPPGKNYKRIAVYAQLQED